ncbi:hypothetical protein ACTNDY_09130 [Tissierellaceae bacterium HCP3S3_D8]
MKKHKKSLIIILTLITILSSVVYAGTANKKELKDETIFEEEFEELKGESVFEEDEFVITPSHLIINEPYIYQSNGRYADVIKTVAKNLNVYFDNQSDSDVEITLQNIDRPQFNETYPVEAGTNPTREYRNIKPGESYTIEIRTIDGSTLKGELRVRTY